MQKLLTAHIFKFDYVYSLLCLVCSQFTMYFSGQFIFVSYPQIVHILLDSNFALLLNPIPQLSTIMPKLHSCCQLSLLNSKKEQEVTNSKKEVEVFKSQSIH